MWAVVDSLSMVIAFRATTCPLLVFLSPFFSAGSRILRLQSDLLSVPLLVCLVGSRV